MQSKYKFENWFDTISVIVYEIYKGKKPNKKFKETENVPNKIAKMFPCGIYVANQRSFLCWSTYIS